MPPQGRDKERFHGKGGVPLDGLPNPATKTEFVVAEGGGKHHITMMDDGIIGGYPPSHPYPAYHHLGGGNATHLLQQGGGGPTTKHGKGNKTHHQHIRDLGMNKGGDFQLVCYH